MAESAQKAGDYITAAVRLVRPLAEGGMGRVWIAEHSGLDTEVVVKVMSPEMALMPDGAERFAREAAVAAAIKSPHVVQVFDHGVTVDASGTRTPYIVMELLRGEDLGAYLAEHGRMDPHRVVAIVVQMSKALSTAHKAGIIHRDIKPENIFLCETDGGETFVKLLDFGTARREVQASSRTTIPGQIMGTPYYMSPEQSVGSTDLDERSDIWSLGIVAYEALTGQKPFEGSSVGAITIAIHGRLPRPSDAVPGLPPAVDEWFARACAQAPEDRFASAREAGRAFAVAIAGAVPADLPTESVFFPPPARRSQADTKVSTPLSPVTRSAAPLIASLPERGAERKYTTMAAGAVMAVAAAVMLAIVMGRGGGAGGTETTSATAPSAVATSVAATSAPSAEAPAPAPVAESGTGTGTGVTPSPSASTSTSTSTSETPKVAAAKPRSVHKPAPAPAKPARPARGGSHKDAGAGGADDDLARLMNATSKQADAPAPADAKESAPPPLPAP